MLLLTIPIILIVIYPRPHAAFNSIIKKVGFVSVDSFYEPDLKNQGFQNWPSGIKFGNNINSPGNMNVKIPKLYHQLNTTSGGVSKPPARTFAWQGDDLIILFNTTSLQSPLCARLTPPLSWIAASGCKVKVLHKNAKPSSLDSAGYISKELDESDIITESPNSESKSTIEIVASRSLVEGTLSCLRMNGFSREDLFRILDKGPWILAFDIKPIISRLFNDLQKDLSLNQSQAVHIVSHCPYLIAQYSKYKGRDVYATARALIEVGYSESKLTEDIMRFPSILSAPPDRIRGWMALLRGYGVAVRPELFGKLLRRAPFMFYVNAPALNDIDNSMIPEDASTTASGFVAYEALKVLDLIDSICIKDMDKVVRTQPLILLESSAEVRRRINFFLNLFMETTVATDASKTLDDGIESLIEVSPGEASSWVEVESPMNLETAQIQLGGMVLTYPAILSIKYEQMRLAANALRDNGLRRREVIYLAKRYPPVLNRGPNDIRNILIFFRYQCGLRKEDVLPFINKYPAIFGCDVGDLQAKVNYLYQSLGGTPTMIKKFPTFFAYDLDTHLKPRAEFLRALNIDPLKNGLVYLVTTPITELVKSAGVKQQLYNEFNSAYLDVWKKKRQQDEFFQVSRAPLRSFPIMSADQDTDSANRFSDSVDIVFDELDFAF